VSSIRRQVAGIISTCKTVIAAGKGSDLPPLDAAISTIAAVILEQVKAEYPNDKVLQSVKLGQNPSWTALLAGMQTLYSTLMPRWERANKPDAPSS
jgi:hypothetical protein